MKTFSFWGAMVALSLASGCATNKVYKDISVAEVKARLEKDDKLVILDVRTKDEYESQTWHLPGAILIPVHELENRFHELDSLKGKEIVAYCLGGGRSARASKFLGEKGFRVLNMVGGITAWNEMKGDTIKTRKGRE
ncbi:MAG: rhodanese-like domain-containing protein [Bacteroidota bacterium]